MAKLVGVVSKVIGEVFAVGSDGTRRVLMEGDRLYAGEQLETGAAGAVAVRLHNGAELTLGRDSSLSMTSDLLADRAPHVQTHDVAPSEAQLSDVERLQQAIAAGADPSESAEAPAAGPTSNGPPGALGGGHSFVLLAEVGDRVDPQVGFATAGFNGIPELANRYLGDLGNDHSVPPLIPAAEDHLVYLQGLDQSPAELTLNEANLPLGSASDPAALTQHGSFTVVAQDGVFNLNVGGINVVTAGVVTGIGQSITTGLGNTLTITGYNPATGVVSYSYTLTGAEQHADGAEANTLGEHLPVLVSDSDGDVAHGSLDVIIRDDVPKAVDDGNAVTATEQHTELTGNVLSNDIQGADRVAGGPVIAGTFTGTYGTLVLAADGSYTYTLNANDPDFKNLGGGGNGVEKFIYTLKDADGDTSSATLTLNVSNLNDSVQLDGLQSPGSDLSVYEKNLSDGSAPDANALTQQGSFKVTALDGLQSLTVGGISVVSGGVAAGLPQSLVTPEGNTLTILGYDPATGTVSYSYTLVDNESHPTGNGINSISEYFSVVAKDIDGSTASGTLGVNIVDDVPQAHYDISSVAKGDIVRGNVLSNDTVGADTLDGGNYVVGIRAGSDTSTSAIGHLDSQVMGQYGYLTLDAEGNAVYHSDPNVTAPRDAIDTFVYTIRDADGDESTTTITINVHDNRLIASEDTDVTVYEKALDLNKDGNDLAAGTVNGSNPTSTGETASGSLVGSVSGGSGALTYSLVGDAVGQYGQIQINPDGSYTYTLTSPANTPGADSAIEHFTYKATDALGNSTTSSIAITIVDDVPTAISAERSITPGQVDSNILLVIDVSSSMAAASGVPGLSRLALAKQAINALLDKYDDMGDIKVQIVTFGTGASIEAAQWLSIDEAKAIVNGLHAGGSTYYDSAVTAAKTAFELDGKLSGAQNVSYFFSDGAPTPGHAITAEREATWETFLDQNGIKTYAIGMGTGVNENNLNPLAYDGSTHTDTQSVVVTDLSQLGAVLSGTVQGAPITGSLMSGGDFGADGGFIKALLVDGTTYTFDPKANGGQGGYVVSGGADKASFDAVTHTLNIKTSLGGTLVVDMDNGAFTYSPPKGSGENQLERFGFTASDNDGDTSSAELVVRINANHAPVAGADHIISNIAGATISVPAEALLANDSDAEHDPLSATPTTFNTSFGAKGADFGTAASVPKIYFNEHASKAENQLKSLDRSAFAITSGSMTAALVVFGYLGAVSSHANAEDVINVTLRKGETLQLDHDRPDGNLAMEWKDASGGYQPLADGGSFTASHDGVYSIHVSNLANPAGTNKVGPESYQLSLVVDYSNAENEVHHASYTLSDHQGGTAAGAVDITYQASSTLNGTSGDDVLLAGAGNDTLNGGDGHDVLVGGEGDDQLYGGNGDDLLIGGAGNDLLDGGAGIDTASYASAGGAVSVDLSHAGPQDTGGAGTDTLTGIENLVGSDYGDTLIGDAGANLLSGGMGNDVLGGAAGNDILIGGAGNDTLTGGSGNDTFVWQRGDSGHDTVTDFTPGSDHLDLSQLLQGENASAASLDDYLHFKISGTGSDVVSTIEVSSVAGAAPTQTIDLAGIDLAQHYGVTAGAGGVISAGVDTATVINGMLNDHSLKVDTV
ncbi:retention module-containing protein [Pseudomonas putida]